MGIDLAVYTTSFTRLRAPDCSVKYFGETARRLEEKIKDHGGRDKNLHVLRHSLENSHQEIKMENVQIMNKNYSNYYNRNVSEIIYI